MEAKRAAIFTAPVLSLLCMNLRVMYFRVSPPVYVMPLGTRCVYVVICQTKSLLCVKVKMFLPLLCPLLVVPSSRFPFLVPPLLGPAPSPNVSYNAGFSSWLFGGAAVTV